MKNALDFQNIAWPKKLTTSFLIDYMIKEIKEQQLLNNNGKLIASHMAKSLHVSHEDTENILKKIDVLTAYDGMKLVF